MSYTFYSFHTPDSHNIEQWANRSVTGELESCTGRTLESIFSRHLPLPPSRIIEAGCGLGGWVLYLRDRGYDIVGIENQEEIVARVKEERPDAPVQLGDILNIEDADDSFDAYISLGVIEHFEEGPQEALREAFRVLKPGGLALITVPYLSLLRRIWSHPLRNFYFFVRRMMKGRDDRFWEYRYTKKELFGFLEEAGFEIVAVEIDDYVQTDRCHHIGLYADFFFLREKDGEIWELNRRGKVLLRAGRILSPWFFCSGLHVIAKKPVTG